MSWALIKIKTNEADSITQQYPYVKIKDDEYVFVYSDGGESLPYRDAKAFFIKLKLIQNQFDDGWLSFGIFCVGDQLSAIAEQTNRFGNHWFQSDGIKVQAFLEGLATEDN